MQHISIYNMNYFLLKRISFGCEVFFCWNNIVFCVSHNFGMQDNLHLKYFFVDFFVEEYFVQHSNFF